LPRSASRCASPAESSFRGNAQEGSNAALYERVARGWPSREGYLSMESFQLFADLAGLSPREIVKRLPKM